MSEIEDREDRVAALRQASGEEHPDTLAAMLDLAEVLWAEGRLAAARLLEEQVVAARRRLLGESHGDTLKALGKLATTIGAQGDLHEARRLQEHIVAHAPVAWGEDGRDTLRALNNLAGTVAVQGDLLGARELLEAALAEMCRRFGEEDGDSLAAMGNLAAVLWQIGERDEHADHLNAFLSRREGPMAVAFAPEGSPEVAIQALTALGLHPSEPRALGRQLELPEGTVVPRFSLVTLLAEETPGLECFLCTHLTPQLVRRPEWLAHPNGVFGLNSVHLLVADTAPLLPAYDRLFGLHEVTTTDAVASVRAGPHRILFSTPDDFMTMHPGTEIDPDFPLPGIAALELAVQSRDDTADFLTQWQIPFDEAPDGRLTVPAEEANGTVLFFAEQ